MPRKIATALLFVLFAAAACAQAPAETARTKMASVKIFAFGGVGYAGVTSEGELLFEQIMSKSPIDAVQDFETLYATGNPQAKAYALSGFRRLDRERFRALLTSARASRESVETMHGCIIETTALKGVANDLDAAQYDYWLYRIDKRARPAAESSPKPLGVSLHR